MVRNDGKAGASIRVEYLSVHPGLKNAPRAREVIVTTTHDGLYVGPGKEERFLVTVSPDSAREVAYQLDEMGLFEQHEMISESDVVRMQGDLRCVFAIEETSFTRELTRDIPVSCNYQYWLTALLRSKINGPRHD